MPLTLRNLAFPMALLGMGAGMAQAQEGGYFSEFKLRTGLALTSSVSGNSNASNDHLTKRTIGAGLTLGYQWGEQSLSVELGYQYKPGDQYLTDVTQDPRTLGLNAPNPLASVDSRRNSLSGVAFRLSYEHSLVDDWYLRGGLQIGGGRYRQEYIGDVTDTPTDGTGKPIGSYTYRNTYNATPTTSTMPVSPFLGVSYRFNPGSALEVNLVSLAYHSINDVHTIEANDHGSDALQENGRRQLHLEVGYVFRF